MVLSNILLFIPTSGNDSIGLLFFQMGRWFNHQFSEHPPDCAHVRSSIIGSKGITTTCLGPEKESLTVKELIHRLLMGLSNIGDFLSCLKYTNRLVLGVCVELLFFGINIEMFYWKQHHETWKPLFEYFNPMMHAMLPPVIYPQEPRNSLQDKSRTWCWGSWR